MKIDEEVKNLGKLKYGKQYKFSYNLTNNTDKDLKIKKIEIGCSACTKASCNKMLLQPTDTARIEVIFTPGSIGIQTKKIVVVMDDNTNYILSFKSIVNE